MRILFLEKLIKRSLRFIMDTTRRRILGDPCLDRIKMKFVTNDPTGDWQSLKTYLEMYEYITL